MGSTPGKRSAVIALLANPAVRKVILRNARRAVGAATTAAANRSAGRSSGPGTAGAAADPAGPSTGSRPGGPKVDAAAVTGIVGSVAKPVAERMAAHPTGRTVLETLNSISGEALGKNGAAVGGTAGNPETAKPLNAFVSKLAGAAAAASSGARTAQAQPKPAPARVNFTPVQPQAAGAPAADPAPSIKWPPRKSAARSSGTDSAPE